MNAELHQQNLKCLQFLGTYNWQNQETLHFFAKCQAPSMEKAKKGPHHAKLPCHQLWPIAFQFWGQRMSIHQRPQLQMVHQSKTIISPLDIIWCYIFNTRFIRTSINWFHQNMKSEYKMYINWWFNLHFHHINHQKTNPQKTRAHFRLYYPFV